MTQLVWQKSSFSGGGEGECVEVAAAGSGQLRFRESDRPAQVATATPAALAALIDVIKARGGCLHP